MSLVHHPDVYPPSMYVDFLLGCMSYALVPTEWMHTTIISPIHVKGV